MVNTWVLDMALKAKLSNTITRKMENGPTLIESFISTTSKFVLMENFMMLLAQLPYMHQKEEVDFCY